MSSSSSTFACLVAETGGPARKSSPQLQQNKSSSSSPTVAVAQQRRAKISIDASTSKCSVRSGNSLFTLKVEYNSTASMMIPSRNNNNNNNNRSSPLVVDQTERKFSFQIGTSKIEWVSPDSSSADHNDHHGNQNNSHHHHHHHYEHTLKLSKMVSLNNEDKNGVAASSSLDADVHQSLVTFNLIITFERYLEARTFARHMTWLIEIYMPSVASTTIAPSSSFSLSPTTQACALVALPIQWWFEGWSVNSASSFSNNNLNAGGRNRMGSFFPGAATLLATTSSHSGLTDSSKNSPERDDEDHQGNPPSSSNKNNKLQQQQHPLLTSNPALILSSSGIANWTWTTSNSDSSFDHLMKKDQQHFLSVLSEDKTLGVEAHTSLHYSFSVPPVLPLLESPKPTQICDEKSLAWAPCFSAPMLSSAIEGSTVFYRPPANSSSSSSSLHFEAMKMIGTELQPVPLHSPETHHQRNNNGSDNNNNNSSGAFDLNMSITASFSVADVVAAAQQDLIEALAEAPEITAKNIGTMNAVSTVLLDSISKKVFVSEKTGNSSIMELAISLAQPPTSSSSSTMISNKKCEFVSRTSLLQKNSHNVAARQSFSHLQRQHQFVAVPLQEAIVEASSFADNLILEESNNINKNQQQRLKDLFQEFYLGPNTSSISASARVLCVVTNNANASSSFSSSGNAFMDEPTPIVYDVKKKTLVVLNRTPENAAKHWTSLLIESCFPSCFGSPELEILSSNSSTTATTTNLSPHLIPVVLLPTRTSPAFPNPNKTNSTNNNKNQQNFFDPQQFLLSEGISFFANNSRNDSSENHADSTLHDVLLVSALKNSIFGPIGSSAASASAFLLGGGNIINSSNNSSSSSQMFNFSKLLLHKPKALPHINVLVVGSVGCGKSTLIKALSNGILSSSWMNNKNKQNNNNSYSSNFDFSYLNSDGSRQSTMAEDLVFSCSYDTFNGYSPVTSSVFSCCSANSRTINDKFNKVQPVLTEAPAQSLPALAGTIATSDVVLLVINCLDPHSLAWIEDKVRPILEQERTPCLSVDAESLHYASSPSVMLVTVNSTSYRRTVTPEEVADLAKRLKCQVADLEFGSSSSSGGGVNASNTNVDDDDESNRVLLNTFANNDAKVITATVGRSVQASAGYSRLVNSGWLPLHADWLMLALVFHWDRIFLMKNRQLMLNREENNHQQNDGMQASATPRANDESNKNSTTSSFSSYLGKSLLCMVLEDPSCVGINENISKWIESDLNFTGGCPFSIYDCANHIAIMTASRDIRGQLIKLMCLKNCVQRRSVLKMISAIQSLSTDVWGQKRFQNNGSSKNSSPSNFDATPSSGYRTGTASSSSRHHSPREENEEDDDEELENSRRSNNKNNNTLENISAIKTKKTAKKLFVLFSKKPSNDEMGGNNNNNEISLDSSSSYAIFRHQTTNGGRKIRVSSSGKTAVHQQEQHLGLTPSAVLFLMTAFGVVVPVSWVHSLWNEIVLATGSSSSSSIITHHDPISSSLSPPLPQSLWLKFLNVISPSSKANTPRHHQSVFTSKQFSQADFSFVIFHWILEIAKTSSSEFYSSVRSGWLARPSDVDAEVNKNSPSSRSDHDNDNDDDENEDARLNRGSKTMGTKRSSSASPSSSPLSSPTTTSANPLLATIRCRHCGVMRTNDQVVRCVVCERKCCIVGDKRCALFVGGREADQRRQALLSIARTTGGASDEKTIAMMLKQLPHVCQVCLMAHPPVTWQLDEEATTCYCCGAKFSLTKRRHHCRRDGTVVCGPCSKFEGPAFGYSSIQRMCISCYDAPSPFVALMVDDGNNNNDRENQKHNHHHRAAGTTRNQDDDDNDNYYVHHSNFAPTFDKYNIHEEDDEKNEKRGNGGGEDDDDDEDEDDNDSCSNDEDEEDDDEDARSSLDLESTSTLSRSFFSSSSSSKKGRTIEDPRVVFAPWAHLVLNSEPTTVYKQPWYETIDERVAEDVLNRIRHMIQHERQKFFGHQEASAAIAASLNLPQSSLSLSASRVVPRAEYVVRQPGYLEEADKELEDAAVGEEYPSEFDPDE